MFLGLPLAFFKVFSVSVSCSLKMAYPDEDYYIIVHTIWCSVNLLSIWLCVLSFLNHHFKHLYIPSSPLPCTIWFYMYVASSLIDPQLWNYIFSPVFLFCPVFSSFLCIQVLMFSGTLCQADWFFNCWACLLNLKNHPCYSSYLWFFP